MGFPGGSDSKESACNVEDLCSIPGLGGSPGEGNGNPLQYSCLENLMDRAAWWATVHGVAESDTTEQLPLHFPPNTFLFALGPGTAVLPMLSLQATGFLSKHEVGDC